jgi:VWFA-related protein
MRLFAASLPAIIMALLTAGAQQNPPQTPQFRAGVDLLQLDVTVTDKKTHLPVRGLTLADFIVLEDNKPQTIAAFAAVDIPDPPALPIVGGRPVTWMRDISPDVQSNMSAGTTDGRLFVMVLDDAMIPAVPGIVQQAKKAARDVIEKLSPADRMAVVLTSESKHAQDFTNSRAKLLVAVDRMQFGFATYLFGWDDYTPPVPGGLPAWQPPVQTDSDIRVREGSLGTLVAVADALMAAPERRKVLVYISPGIPVNGGMTGAKLADGSGLATHEANKRLAAEMPELFRRMQRANINIYPIDPSGTAGMGPVVSNALNGLPSIALGTHSPVDPITGQLGPGGASPPAGRGGKAPTSSGGGTPDPNDFGRYAANLDLNFLLASAANTGGRAIVNTDDFGPGIEQLFSENGSYYLLGYRPPPTDPPGTLHRLTVRVNRPDVDVRTRSGYYTPKPDAADKRVTPMARAVASLLPSADLPLQAAVAPLAGKASADPVVTIALGLQCPPPAQSLSDSVEIQISAFTPDGVARGTSTQQAAVMIRAATTPEPVRYEALSQIRLKPGRYQLRIAAHSTAGNATGSVFADVEVPDFTKERVSLSGVFIEAQPGVASAPKAAFAAIVPVNPTSERTFTKSNRAAAFVRLYQGATGPLSAVSLKTRIINESGVATTNDTVTLAPDRFDAGTRSSDYRLEIPVATLAPGQYLLALEATIDAVTARRYVRFTIR